MKSFRDIRVIPIVLIAIFGLAVLKVAGLVIDGGYVFDYQPAAAKRSWAQESFNFPTGKTDTADITGSVHEKPKEEAAKPAAAAPEVAKPDGTVVYPDQSSAGLCRRSARFSSGCSRGGRNSKRVHAKSTFAKACSRPPKSELNRVSRN